MNSFRPRCQSIVKNLRGISAPVASLSNSHQSSSRLRLASASTPRAIAVLVSRPDGIDEVVTIVADRQGESHFLAGYLMRMALATNLNRWPRKEALD